jgi:ribosome-associated heat shock protein Hsp15
MEHKEHFGQSNPPDQKIIRLDKWLKIARIFKTRTQAGEACEAGHVKVNGAPAKSAKLIKPGDTLTVRAGGRYRELEVLDVVFKSIAAKDARTLFHEERNRALSEDSLELLSLFNKSAKGRAFRHPGRPTKRDRRTMEKVRGH